MRKGDACLGDCLWEDLGREEPGMSKTLGTEFQNGSSVKLRMSRGGS